MKHSNKFFSSIAGIFGVTAGIGLILIPFAIIFAMICFVSFLIMIIWNNVIVKKFPNSNIQKLNLWEALALIIFFGILTGGGTTVVYTCKNQE